MNKVRVFDNVVRLGRHVNHDPKSKQYAFDGAGVTYQSVRHQRHIPVLDQGQLGSCTGNAGTGNLGTGSFWSTIPSGLLSTSDANADEKFAVQLYSDATQIDDYVEGNYPPEDTGSDGLSVAKVLQKRGLVSGYQHTFSFNDALKALTLQPVIVGINWYNSFEAPDSNGIIKIAKRATIEGGHEIVADEIDAKRQLVGFTNSWTEQWGIKGRFYLSFADFERLLGEDGDVTVFVPNTQPAPAPVVPTPVVNPIITPSPEDVALWADMTKWAKLKGLA